MATHQAPPSLGFSRQDHWSGLPFPSPMQESEKWKWSHSVVSDSWWPHGLQPSRLLCPWDFPGKSTGVGCHCLLLTLSSILHSSARYIECKNHLVYSFFLKMSLLFSCLLTLSKSLSIWALCLLSLPGWQTQLVSLTGLEQNVGRTSD